MFLFPVLYIFFFCFSVYYLLNGKTEAFLVFVIFCLPTYITSLSVAFIYGFKQWIPFLQAFKELIILLALASVIKMLKKKPVLQRADWLVILFGLYTLIYVFIPLGGFSFQEKVLSYKSISFFPFIYFTGRLFDLRKINLTKQFYYICIVTICAAVVVLGEVITYTHFQIYSGYAEYMYYYFNQEPAGHYGLSWTFEIEDGPKRFASFFANPLDHAAGTLVSLSVIATLITTQTKKIRISNFILLVAAASLLSVLFALSRASFISYFVMLYAFALVTRKKDWLRALNYGMLAVLFIGLIWIKGDLYSFIINTITFSNSSSLSHIVDWLASIEAITTHPLGMGFGFAGRIGTTTGLNIGGENQLLIIGVQTGIIPLILYFWLYMILIRTAFRVYRQSTGKAKKLALFVLLTKIGMIIPLLTAEAESYVYVSYITWFMSGLLVNIKSEADDYRHRYHGSETGPNRPEDNVGGTVPAIQTA